MTRDDANGVANESVLFYSARDSLDALAEIPCDAVEPALKRIGPPPFVRKGFPLLGLLATVYDHVANCVESSTSPVKRESPLADGDSTT